MLATSGSGSAIGLEELEVGGTRKSRGARRTRGKESLNSLLLQI